MDIRTAFVTGASGGIGEALALELAARGVDVALSARRGDALTRIAESIAEAGGRARIFPLDVRDPEATLRTLERADEAMDGIDLVVANAGVGKEVWSGKLTYGECEPLLAVNVLGATATLTALLPRMIERRRGHLVGISSLAQYRGFPRNAAYSASKAYLSTFLESLRVDLRTTGIRVTDVRPGFVRTAMTAKNAFPMPFLVEVDEAARLIVKGIASGRPVVAFPWPLATAMRASTVLPARLWDHAITRGRR